MYPWRDTLERIIETPLIVASELLQGISSKFGESLTIMAFRLARPYAWYHNDFRSIVVEVATGGMTFFLMGIATALVGYALGHYLFSRRSSNTALLSETRRVR